MVEVDVSRVSAVLRTTRYKYRMIVYRGTFVGAHLRVADPYGHEKYKI